MLKETSNAKNNNRFLLVKYAGLAMQWAIALLLAVWGGRKIDFWFKLKKPLFAWILPVVAIVALLYKIIKDTSGTGKK
jgi:membrane protein DedA with SNARE-associated domain